MDLCRYCFCYCYCCSFATVVVVVYHELIVIIYILNLSLDTQPIHSQPTRFIIFVARNTCFVTDDQTYMSECDDLQEYVLNDHGCVYRGNAYFPKGKEWNFGQVRKIRLRFICVTSFW